MTLLYPSADYLSARNNTKEEETGGLTVLGGKCYNARRSAGLAEGGAARAAPAGPEA